MTKQFSTSVRAYSLKGTELEVVFHSSPEYKYTYIGAVFLFTALVREGKSIGQAVAELAKKDGRFIKESIYA